MDRIIKIARKILSGSVVPVGEKTRKVLNHYGADNINNGMKWQIEISDIMHLGIAYFQVKAELQVSYDGSSVKMWMNDYIDESYSRFSPSIKESTFTYKDDSDFAERLEKFLKEAKKSIHNFALKVQKEEKSQTMK